MNRINMVCIHGSIYGLAVFDLPSLPCFHLDPSNFVGLEGVPVFENYIRLVMYSSGFEDAWKRHGLEPGDMFFAKCLQSAMAVVRHVGEVYIPSGFLM